MLTKILFTLLVIVGVMMFYRTKNMGAAGQQSQPEPEVKTTGVLSTRRLAYLLIGVLVAISISIYVYHWNQGNRIVNIKVTSDGGETVNYQARHKDIKGRSFVSLDGIQVTLGQSDRVERLQE